LFVKPRQAETALDRRRHNRVAVVLRGRYMLADQSEYLCETIDMSPAGVALKAPVTGVLGERVVAYLDQIGRIEGRIARFLPGGFAMTINLPASKLDKIADKLTWLANREALLLPEDRRHDRIVPRVRQTTLRLIDGSVHPVRLIDISLSGAGVESALALPLGVNVVIGKTHGRVIRNFRGGMAIEFDRVFRPEELSENTQL
jgi:hypothetical protein